MKTIQERVGAGAPLAYRIIDSPLGGILLAGDERGLAILNFQAGTSPLAPDPKWRKEPEAFAEEVEEIGAYFSGERTHFNLRLSLTGTAFQLRVWEELTRIPYGETASYAEIARAVGSPKAVRAVGSANSLNPIPLIVPCHRVIGTNGRLTGYRGGVELKRRLLEHEMLTSGKALRELAR
ncbi:MAG TPA: methylated-DNA--[protein]-cysteine S-methyltransferase [Spirochaetia bacterium]|nr:methylated-DNA--[protein]-cysteine S-methyltransferase [Spirochaetia bacterium]